MKICTYLTLLAVMGLIILIFPYIMTLFNRFNKERVLVWRKFFLIVSVCYLPFIIILGVVYIYELGYLDKQDKGLYMCYYLFDKLSLGYFILYCMLVVIIEKRINLQLARWKTILLGATFYFIATTMLFDLFKFCKDPLTCMFIHFFANSVMP